jgi:replicative DNA helicase
MNVAEISDIQSESGLIGTAFSHPEYISHVDYLKPNHFYSTENACIYWAIQELYKDGISNFDAYNISNKLQSHPGVQKTIEKYNLPSVQEFIELYRETARDTLEEFKMLAENVTTLAYKRDLYKLSKNIEKYCFKKDIDLDKLNTTVYQEFDGLVQQYLMSEEIHTLGDDIDAIWDEIVSRRTENGLYGIPSKFPSFIDYFTYEPGELVIIQAKYKQGKSVFLMNEVVHKLKNGIATLVIDSEMPTRLYVERLLSHLTGIELKRIKNGKYSDEEGEVIAQWRGWIKKQPFVHIYNPNLTMEKLYSICKVLQNKMDLGFVVYDYLKSNETSSSDNYNLLGAKCDFLKNNIAGELDIPVLAACQLNRNGEVADSMKINRYLSVGIKWEYKTQEMIARDGLQCGNAYAKIYVNRLGRQMQEDDASDYIDFVFSGETMTIVEAEQHNIEEDF